MSQLLKQSTAVNITVLVVGSADHIAGLTGASLTIYASKAGGTPAAITPTVTELDSTHTPGLYKLALTTGHTDTLGELQLHVTAAGADPTDVAHQVVLDLPGIAQTGDNYARLGAPAGASVSADVAAVKSDLDAGVNVTKVNGTAQTARDLGASVLLSSGTGTGQVSLSSGKVLLSTSVWDEVLSSHLASGSTGAALNAAGSSGDPWATAIPGAYGAGTAGLLVGTNLNATVSSRLATSGYTAPDNADIALIKAKTDNLPAAPAAVSDIPTAATNASTLLDLANGIETGLTPRQALRLISAAMAGKLSGATTTTITIRNTADSKNRITATVDADGNRSAVTYDLT